MNNIILIEQHKITLLDSKTSGIKWEIDESKNISGTYRLDKYIFLYTYDWTGTVFTSLINLKDGSFYWKEKKLNVYSNCIAIDNKIFFVNSACEVVVIDIETGNEVFKEKFTYKKWYTMVYPQLVVYNGNVIVFSKKNALKIDLKSKKLSDYVFRNINIKNIVSMNDKYNIAVNKYTSSGSGGEAYMYGAYAGDAGGGGGDAGGGDGGG